MNGSRSFDRLDNSQPNRNFFPPSTSKRHIRWEFPHVNIPKQSEPITTSTLPFQVSFCSKYPLHSKMMQSLDVDNDRPSRSVLGTRCNDECPPLTLKTNGGRPSTGTSATSTTSSSSGRRLSSPLHMLGAMRSRAFTNETLPTVDITDEGDNMDDWCFQEDGEVSTLTEGLSELWSGVEEDFDDECPDRSNDPMDDRRYQTKSQENKENIPPLLVHVPVHSCTHDQPPPCVDSVVMDNGLVILPLSSFPTPKHSNQSSSSCQRDYCAPYSRSRKHHRRNRAQILFSFGAGPK